MIQQGDIVIGLALASQNYMITVEDTEWLVLDISEKDNMIHVGPVPDDPKDYAEIQKDYDAIKEKDPDLPSYYIGEELGATLYDVRMDAFKTIGSLRIHNPQNNADALPLLNKD